MNPTYPRPLGGATALRPSLAWAIIGRTRNLCELNDFPRRPLRLMSIWRRLFGQEPKQPLRPQRLDYLNEGLALERQGDFEAALTSYRLALRDNPTDSRILLNMAIAFTKTSQPDEAIRHYRRALEVDQTLGGAHYGVAFLLLKRGDTQQAAEHLRAFLARPPKGPDAERWVKHAESELQKIDKTSQKASETR